MRLTIDEDQKAFTVGRRAALIPPDQYRDDDDGDINAKFGRELAALTARGWRSQRD